MSLVSIWYIHHEENLYESQYFSVYLSHCVLMFHISFTCRNKNFLSIKRETFCFNIKNPISKPSAKEANVHIVNVSIFHIMFNLLMQLYIKINIQMFSKIWLNVYPVMVSGNKILCFVFV